MEELKKFISVIYTNKDFSHKSLKNFKQLLDSQRLSNKNKQVLQGFLVDVSLLSENSRDAAKWFFNIYSIIENADNAHVVNEVYFSPGEDCRNAIVDQIKNATQSIQICVFTISDDLISREIVACKHRGIDVKIITDDDKSMDKGSDIHDVSDAGIPVKMDTSPNHMHHKFAIIDSKILITGSYNWTRSAYTRNQENILITNAIEVIEKYEIEFKRLWKAF